MNTINSFYENLKRNQEDKLQASKEFGNARTCARFKNKDSKHPVLITKDGWVLAYFNIRSNDCSDYVIYRQSDVDSNDGWASIPVIEFKCRNHSLEFVEFIFETKVSELPPIVFEMIEQLQREFRTSNSLPVPVRYLKLYIAVLDDCPDFMVPTLVAHSMLGAHALFSYVPPDVTDEELFNPTDLYHGWLNNSFRKCVVRVSRKEFEKIKKLDNVYLGHENTTLGGEKSCAIPYPVWNDEVPNVLKFAKLWRPTCD